MPRGLIDEVAAVQSDASLFGRNNLHSIPNAVMSCGQSHWHYMARRAEKDALLCLCLEGAVK